LLTPQDYSKALNESFSKSQGFILKDLFAIPDYDSYFNGCPDVKFGCYAKKEKTQLQFTFEAVEVSTNFPLGCKITYRAYSQDQVIEVYQEETPNLPGINLKARSVEVRNYPEEDTENGTPAGMYIMQQLPPNQRKIKPLPLVLNSRSLLDEVIVNIEKAYQKFQPKVISDWKDWSSLVPEDNDVDSFISK